MSSFLRLPLFTFFGSLARVETVNKFLFRIPARKIRESIVPGMCNMLFVRVLAAGMCESFITLITCDSVANFV